MLGEVARLNVRERLVVIALNVGDRRARDHERCDQHRHPEHRAQQRRFGMESKSSHRSSITKGTKKTTKGTKISLALLCAFCDSSFASFVILPHHSRPQQCINDATKSFSFLCFFGGSAVWRFGYLSKAVTTAARLFKAFLCTFASLRKKSALGMTVAKCDRSFGSSGKEN
jgi:hypothetical protein